MIKQLSNHPTRRWREFICVVFGHEWNTYGSETDNDHVREEYNVCAWCFLSRRLVWIEQPCKTGRAWKAVVN